MLEVRIAHASLLNAANRPGFSVDSGYVRPAPMASTRATLPAPRLARPWTHAEASRALSCISAATAARFRAEVLLR